MNTPNKLTLLRILLIPVFLVLMYAYGLPHNYLWACGLCSGLPDRPPGWLILPAANHWSRFWQADGPLRTSSGTAGADLFVELSIAPL
jgi:phosphatidylglycerophosphate synthase